jgi:hypothetical protein
LTTNAIIAMAMQIDSRRLFGPVGITWITSDGENLVADAQAYAEPRRQGMAPRA